MSLPKEPANERLDNAMTSSTGGEAIVSGLVAHGVDTVFGLPGAQIYGLFDAFQQAQLKVIGARHEQACGYMAYGYARSSGKPGVFSVVPGPGVLNAGAALLTALGANEPVLCLTGQVPTAFLDKGRGTFLPSARTSAHQNRSIPCRRRSPTPSGSKPRPAWWPRARRR